MFPNYNNLSKIMTLAKNADVGYYFGTISITFDLGQNLLMLAIKLFAYFEVFNNFEHI